MAILNLTQHAATNDQINDGVVDLPKELHTKLVELITFEKIPQSSEMIKRANAIVKLVNEFDDNVDFAMIGGAPFFMSILEDTLNDAAIQPLYAFSKRVSVEEVQPDGSVSKKVVFKHEGFVGF